MLKQSAGKAIGWIVRIVIIAGLVAVAVLDPFSSGGDQTTTDTAVIKNYDAVMDIERSGDLFLTETIDVDLPAGKHGIFKIFDKADPRRRGVSHPIQVESVERDGSPEVYTTVESSSRTETIRIGNASVTLEPGVHRYIIRSSTKNVFEEGDANTTLWWWDVVGAGWQMRIESASITANFPATPKKVECVMGENTPCDAQLLDRSMTLKTGALAPFEPVTVRVSFPAAALPAPPTGTNAALTIVLSLIAGLISGSIAVMMVAKTHEKAVGLPVLFEPPQGIYPALGAKVLNEVNSPYALQATLFDLAERGLLNLQGDDNGWNIAVVAEPSQTVMTAAEAHLLAKLGLN
ncbi:MAG: DUF2207 domain-containing protein, partial [Microthrixaceae bacterium]|nr:DUF2207 domain-containing protein [Microthrixaceae bacterium]